MIQTKTNTFFHNQNEPHNLRNGFDDKKMSQPQEPERKFTFFTANPN